MAGKLKLENKVAVPVQQHFGIQIQDTSYCFSPPTFLPWTFCDVNRIGYFVYLLCSGSFCFSRRPIHFASLAGFFSVCLKHWNLGNFWHFAESAKILTAFLTQSSNLSRSSGPPTPWKSLEMYNYSLLKVLAPTYAVQGVPQREVLGPQILLELF